VIVVWDNPELARHLAHAVAEHLRWLRRDGLAAPDELTVLLTALRGGPTGSDHPSLTCGNGANPAVCQGSEPRRLLAASLAISPRVADSGGILAERPSDSRQAGPQGAPTPPEPYEST
jgi:hypothetical protein